MNVMVNDNFEVAAGQVTSADVQVRDAALARLMKAWESKSAKNAKRAAGLSLIAVTLSACGGSGGSGGTTDPTDPVDPVDPTVPVGADGFVTGFPMTSVSGLFFQTAGGGLGGAAEIIALLNGLLETLQPGEAVAGVTTNDIQLILGDIDTGNSAGFGGDTGVIINVLPPAQQSNLQTLLDFFGVGPLSFVTVQTYDAVMISPTSSNVGFMTTAGDDVILLGRTELLHGARIDGGAGDDTLIIIAKGPYAQPVSVINVETVAISHQPNTAGSGLPVNINDGTIVNGILAQTAPGFILPNFNAPASLGYNSESDTWIDLGAVPHITTLQIVEEFGGGGNLFVGGVRNGATLELSGGFSSDVYVSYSFGFTGVVNVVLNGVRFDHNELTIAHNSTSMRIESSGGGDENYIYLPDFGAGLRFLTITGDTLLHLDGPVGFIQSASSTINASANTGGVILTAENSGGNSIASNTINLVGSQGDDYFTLTADAFNITGGEGENTYDLTGSYSSNNVGTGMRLVFNGAAGEDTIIIQGPVSTGSTVLLAGSSITGMNNTVVTTGDVDISAVPAANLSGVSSIVMGGMLTVSQAQVVALGADTFSAFESTEGTGSTETLLIKMTASATLSDLLDLSALSPDVKLSFIVPAGVTLTMSAEELHLYLIEGAIVLGDGSGGTSAGSVVITGAGQNFNPFVSTFVDVPGLGLVPGGGTLAGASNNLTVERSADGFDRPSQELLVDELIIDSSDGPVVVEANGFGNEDHFTIPQTNVLIMQGENDITFMAPVSFSGQPNFTVDFSAVTGMVTGLEIVDFQDITSGIPSLWGEIIGNGGARIDVQLDGNVGNATNGLISSGVSTYVVTDLNGGSHQFWTSDPTEDLEVLGLQGNAGGTITFGNVRNGVSFLMEGDGFGAFGEVPKALQPLDQSNIGTLVAIFNPGSGTVNAVVEINNQGVELGAASDGGLRVLNVDGIQINGAQTITLNVADGDAVINSLGGSSVLEDVVITSANDVTLVLDDGANNLDSIDASGVVGDMTLVIEGLGVDLSDVTLTGIDAIILTAGAELTLTVAQALDIGMANISVEDGGAANLILNVTEDFDLDLLDLANLPEGLTLELSVQSEVVLNITGDQLVALFEAGVTITDGSGADDAGTVNITDFNQTHLPFPVINDYSQVMNLADAQELAGTVTLDPGIELYVGQGYGVFPGLFAWELEGGTLGISVQGMADGLVVNNGDVQFYFAPDNSPINAAGYTNIGTLFINEFGLPATFNVESITFLDSSTNVEIVPLVPLEFDGVDRTVIIGGVPFAINDDGIPFNPATGDAGPVTSGVNLLFNNVTGEANRNVETVTIVFQEGGNIIGDIIIGPGELPLTGGNAFQTLTLISGGDDVNTVEDIFALGNNLLNVNITANEEFSAQTITLSSTDPDLDEGTVTITGTADVTLKAVDAGAGVAVVTIDTVGHTGTLVITGGSPSIDASETLVFEGGADSEVLLDSDGPGGNLGVRGNGTLTLIDASGMAGTLALGEVGGVADGFQLIGGTGVITVTFIGLPSDNWSLDISNSAAGSEVDLGGTSLTSGSLSQATDPVTNETTLTFGDGTTVVTDLPLDLSGYDNVVFGSDVVIELGEGGLVIMTDEQFAEFEAAGGTITGETAKTFDAGIDLTDVRGLTEINIEEGSGGVFTLSSDQIAIARIVDADGNPVSDFGDIQALNDEVGLGIIVKNGATFEVTDNAINNVDINTDPVVGGTGAVIVTMEGTAGATLNVDTLSGDNLPGQSITVTFTLDGVPGSIVLNNTATNFTSTVAIENGLAGTLDAVAGLNAEVVGGVVQVQVDVPGTSFVITGVDVTNTNGMEISAETFVQSTSLMGNNEVADTTHVFPTLAAPAFYLVTGTLGGDADVEIEGTNLIDLTFATFAGGLDSINITGGAELKLNFGDLADLDVTGTGSVQADVAGTNTNVDLSGIDVPLQFNVTSDPVEFSGDTLFNPGQPLTLVGADGFPAPGPVFDLTGLNTAGDVPNLNRPSEVVLDNVNLTLTPQQADELLVTGASQVTVVMDGIVSNNDDLSGIGVPLEITSNTDVDFGGNLPPGQPITFSGGQTITLNGNTIPAGAVVTIAAGTTLDVTGATLGAGVSFVMVNPNAELIITGAQVDGTSVVSVNAITGDPEDGGTVTIIDLDGSHDLSGVDGPTLQLTFADDVDAGSVAASAIDGRIITIAGGDPAVDFTLTITGLEDVPDADLSGLTLALDTGGNTDVIIEVTGDVTIGEDADFGIGGASTITLAVLGGVVDVEDGADLSAIGAFEVAAGATLVADQSLTDPNSVIDPADVSGAGTLEITGFDAGAVLSGSNGGATADIDFVTFTFDGTADYEVGGEVLINNFLVGGAAGRDQLDLNDIMDVLSVSTSANKANLEGFNDGAVLILTSDIAGGATTKAGMEGEFGADRFGDDDSVNIFVTVDAGNNDWYVWLWEDGVDADGGGTNVASDGFVGQSELTLISVIDSTDSLTAANFIV